MKNFAITFKEVYLNTKSLGFNKTVNPIQDEINKAIAIVHSISVLNFIEELKLLIEKFNLDDHSIEITPYITDTNYLDLSVSIYLNSNPINKYYKNKEDRKDIKEVYAELFDLVFKLSQNICNHKHLGLILEGKILNFSLSDNFNDVVMDYFLSKKVRIATNKHLLDLDLGLSSTDKPFSKI